MFDLWGQGWREVQVMTAMYNQFHWVLVSTYLMINTSGQDDQMQWVVGCDLHLHSTLSVVLNSLLMQSKLKKKTKTRNISGKINIVNEVINSNVQTKSTESGIEDFVVYGRTVAIEQSNPYRTRGYCKFRPFCVREEESEGKNIVTKGNLCEGSKSKKVPFKKIQKHLDRCKDLHGQDCKKVFNRSVPKQNPIMRLPMEIKTRLLTLKKADFFMLEEPQLFSSTEEAQQVIMNLLCRDHEQFLRSSNVRPFVSGQILQRYLQDVYEYLYNRHIEALSNITAVEHPPQRRSLHILNKSYLFEDRSSQTFENYDVSKNETSEESSIVSDTGEDDILEDISPVRLDQPSVKVMPHKTKLLESN
ncbi:hypothetical protein J6590_002540 [Homalodisca vitripennis]|nr:hypothetical protein J6590_002540 [Homalodisca vitripennis]